MYVIENNKVVANILGTTSATNGIYSTRRVKESVDRSREWNLVNASSVKISSAKKWEREAARCEEYATEINPGEFYVA